MSKFDFSQTFEYDEAYLNQTRESYESILDFTSASPREPSVDIPACIFREGLSGLRAVTKFLHEEKNMGFSEIGRLILRDPRTIQAEYADCKGYKSFQKKDIASENIFISSAALRKRKFSVLEILAVELRDKGFSLSEIADLLGKSPKTIWTVLNRAKKKGVGFK